MSLYRYRDILDTVNCEIILDNTMFGSKLYFNNELKLDTGADITCIRYDKLGIFISEEEFTTKLQTVDNVHSISGTSLNKKSLIVSKSLGIDKKSKPMKAYCLQVSEFNILCDSTLSIGSVPIFVTFDDRFETSLLGKDLLSLLNFSINSDLGYIEFNKSTWYEGLLNYNKVLTPIEQFNRGVYKDGVYLLNEVDTDEIIKNTAAYFRKVYGDL